MNSGRQRIVLVSSEAVPFFKTGGLADVAGALAVALDRAGHEVTLIVPDYRPLRVRRADRLPAVQPSGMQFDVSLNGGARRIDVSWSELPGSGVRLLLLGQPELFDRQGLYGDGGTDYPDNCERFCVFSHAALEVIRRMVLRPHVIHCNDWQTGLIPALLCANYRDTPGLRQAGSVMTIHNMAYQGRFWHLDMPLTGLDWSYFNHHQAEASGQLNLLKTGLAFADQLTTVSPTYAGEIQAADGGYGLDGLLRYRQEDLTGILNGIDLEVWDPSSDPYLPTPFSMASPQPGKADCKRHLQKRLGLAERGDVPLFGMVSRMADQKGFDLIMASADRMLKNDLQLAFLGTGDPHYEQQLVHLAHRYPGRVAAYIGFDEGLAHQIEAGADAFLMPSRFEPCGLNQMYSQRYGTLPIVRRVGGLADSVDNFQSMETTPDATGFAFDVYDHTALAETVERAYRAYANSTEWQRLMQNGMKRDWSWENSAQRYDAVYRKAVSRRGDRLRDGRC